MEKILIEFDEQMESVITKVSEQLPTDFPEHIANSILSGLHQKAARLKKVGIKVAINPSPGSDG